MMPHPRRLHKEERKTRDGAKLTKETQTKENTNNFKKQIHPGYGQLTVLDSPKTDVSR